MKKNILTLVILALFTSATAQSSKMDAFITSLMSKMTVEEKIGQLNLVTPGGAVTGAVVSKDVDEKIRQGKVGGLFGIWTPEKVRQAQKIAVENSRLKIPLLFGLDVIHGHKTIFPIPLGIAATWDTVLIEKSARIAATEATADGLNWVFSPMVDISRDPRWGRISEGNGEDPFLGSAIAAAMVRGYQENDLRKNNTVMACVKHFALYGAAEAGRDYNTVDMSKLKMFEYYLPPYKAAIDAGAGSIMTSFNEIDGIPATANRWLLTDVLRNRWHFKGLVVSDYTSVSEMVAHGLGDLQQVSALALKAGLDMDMVSEGFLNTLQKSLKEGKASMTDINNACRKILEAKYKLGLFENPFRYVDESRPAKEIFTDSNRNFSREIARKSFVLMKNRNDVLPLRKTGKIALVGPLANNQRNMLGTWVVAGEWQKSVSVMQGIKKAVPQDIQILYAKGANITDDSLLKVRTNALGIEVETDDRSADVMIAEAVDAANASDVIVAVVGEAADMSGESSSRSDISLPESQKTLLKALKATGKPLIIVLFTGRPLTLNWEEENADAILNCWFPGTEAGNAVADVLFGDYNPSGKITATFPRSVGQIPIYYNHKNTGRPFHNEEWAKFKSNYLDISNDPLYPFGFGLSYTNFSYSSIRFNKSKLSGNDRLIATLTVTNTGKMAGEETVQLYIGDPVASITQPVKKLIGFQKIQLEPGEMKAVSFNISRDDLSFFNNDLRRVFEPGQFIIYIGTNSRDVQEGTIEWKQ